MGVLNMAGKSPARRAYLRRMTVLMTIYVAVIIGGSYAKKAGLLSDPATILVAVVSGLCVGGVFWAIGRLIVEEQDEFLRMLIVRQALIATGFALSIASIHGFLTIFEVVPKIDLFWVPMLWFIGFAIGAVVNRVQFGTWGQCA